MNFSLSPEQQLIRQNIIDFAEREINAQAAEHDRQQSFPAEAWKKCAQDQRLQGLAVDARYSGAGLDPVSTMLALEALGYGSQDGGLNFSICAQLLSVVIPIAKYGSEEQKKKYLPALCAEGAIAANAMTESASGSDAFSIKTKARKTAEGYRISGSKVFITNGSNAGLVLVYALTDESKGYYGGISAFIIERAAAGNSLKTGETYEKMGLRSSTMCELIFEDVLVPESQVLGGIGAGAGIFNHSMEWERIGMSACHTGTMARLLEQSIAYAQTRTAGQEHIAKKQGVSHRIAGMHATLQAARLLVYKAAAGIDTDRNNALNASTAKLFVSEAFQQLAMDTLQLHGGNGYMTAYGIERVLRDAAAGTIYSGTSDIQKNIIAGWLGL